MRILHPFRLRVLALLLPVLAACSDEEMVSTTDPKPWHTDQYMDTSYRPGDNYFMYCNGTYWNNTELSAVERDRKGFFSSELEEIRKQRIAALTDSRYLKLMQHRQDIGNGYASADAILRQQLTLLDGIQTQEDAWRAIARTMKAGCNDLLDLFCGPINGKVFGILVPAPGIMLNGRSLILTDLAVPLLQLAGMDAASAEAVAAEAQSLAVALYTVMQEEKDNIIFFYFSPDYWQKHPEEAEARFLASQTRANAPGLQMAATVIDELGLSEDGWLRDEMMQPFYVCLETASPVQIKSLLQVLIVQDYIYASPEARQAATQLLTSRGINLKDIGFDDFLKTFYFGYPLSYAFANQYVTETMKEGYIRICEEVRAAFGKRIEAVDWMSHITKQRAQEKLAALHFNVGMPDEWFTEGLPAMDGASYVEDIQQMRRAKVALRVKLPGMSVKQGGLHADISSYSYRGKVSSNDLTLVNAFYQPTGNSVIIYPVMLLPPLYDTSRSDAYNYATFSVIAHEITHGFDSKGCAYDATGALKNWWTVTDKMEFEERCRKLVECYDHLEILPEEMPGVYTPGEQTLSENIADLGGVLTTHQAYVDKLEKEGYFGEVRDEQERKFFRGYAELWREKYNAAYVDYALFQLRDAHSMGKERINGVVMNIDRWYELYDVQWGDMLYLPEERRAYIW